MELPNQRQPPDRKMGRNERCWCGSGLKYKRCHLNRQDQSPDPFHVTQRRLSAAESPKRCMHFDAPAQCNGGIVRAHSLSKKGALEQIALDQHVYTYPRGIGTLRSNDGKLRLVRTGINEASTFSGFCSYHDSHTFEPIDRHTFDGSRSYLGLYAYREFCRELYAKENFPEVREIMRDADKGQSIGRQIHTQDIGELLQLGFEMGVKDASTVKAQFDECLRTGDWSSVQAVYVTFASVPTVCCSSSFTPDSDFNGNRFPEVDLSSDNVPPNAFLHILPTDNGGMASITWLPSSDSICAKLIKSFMDVEPGLRASALTLFALGVSSNVAVSPSWWESLPVSQQAILERMMSLNLPPDNLNANFSELARAVNVDWGENAIVHLR